MQNQLASIFIKVWNCVDWKSKSGKVLENYTKVSKA